MGIKATVSISEEIAKLLEEASKDIKRTAVSVIDDVAKESVKKLKATSPRSKGDGTHYANGWALKRSRGSSGVITVTVYNKGKPSLTHLLEDGHVISNGRGTYGRTEPIRHIKPVEAWANAEVESRIRKELQ